MGMIITDVSQVMQALEAGGANAHIISKYQGMLKSSSGEELEVDKNYLHCSISNVRCCICSREEKKV